MKLANKISVIGVASCYGAKDMRCADAPIVFQKLADTPLFKESENITWVKNIYPDHIPTSNSDKISVISEVCKQLARHTNHTIRNQESFVVIGGDHSCAIGTWSGAYSALQMHGDIGLIWIDAHMDSHTMATSPTNAIHGMPLACLLGYGDKLLTGIESSANKLKPSNVCLIGIRSYEKEEEEFLKKLGVKIFYIEDVEKLGIYEVLKQAKIVVSQNTVAYGMSIDLDGIDPNDAPGVGSPEKNGLNAEALINALKKLDFNDEFIGLEIAELNSERDLDDKTAKLAIQLINTIFQVRKHEHY